MKYKVVIIVVIIFVIIGLGVFMDTSNQNNNSDSFNDMGINSNYTDKWNKTNLTISRNNEYTTLSSSSNSSQWYVADAILKNNSIIEWDNHGKLNKFDFCLISDTNLKNETPINLVNNLNITGNCHVKLIILNGQIIPYVNDVVKNPLPLKTKDNELKFRFQINPQGENISYSNFTIRQG